MAKTWILDTSTKGTGARMVPLEDVLTGPEPKEWTATPAPKPAKPSTAERPARARRRKSGATKRLTGLPPGHVRRKATGEIGRVEAVDPKAGTATVSWLRSGRTSTVPINSISRR